jgi:protease II
MLCRMEKFFGGLCMKNAYLSIFLSFVISGNVILQAEQSAAQIPLEVLFGNPEKTLAKISPDGTQLAYCATSAEDGAINLWVKTLGKENDRVVTCKTKRGIYEYHWASGGKYILYLQDTDGDENYHLYRVNLANNIIDDLTPFPGVKVQIVAQGIHFPDKLVIMMNKDNSKFFDAYHFELNSGNLTLAAQNPGNIVWWVADTKLQVRAAVATNDDGSRTLLVRDAVDQAWRSLLRVDFQDTLKDELYCGVLGFSDDGSTLYLNSSIGVNTRSLMKIDSNTGERTILATDSVYDVAWVTFNFQSHEPELVC